ncbi:DNA sulfur modification protein DndD [Bizionia gelidisalsuginis]|uniref:DNA sulfur modification protein DndD n=1 Tax=Bizionia gelidisalsuginis TaxID=291188 RepID=A0ABY3MBW1_9FLAO|nr:DNA sulfur modification protein DndD [Bizionia gelidisalsuginis]TYC14801.1 DNA sulfur modification protein DndD [Bizionia gelidisalsuginis]
MKFNKLTIENYKSFQYPTAIDFPQSSEGKSIFLIGGMNGAGKTSIMEAINICLYGAKTDFLYKYINRKELAKGNAFVSFELELETDEHETILINRSWSAGATDSPKHKDLTEKLVVVKNGKRVSVQNKEMWQDYINATIPKGITQFFFFDGEKIQEIAADDHSEVRLKSSLEAALGIQYISRLSSDVLYLKQEERKGFVEITDEDITFKESELKKEQRKLTNKTQERDDLSEELERFKSDKEEAQTRFKAIFNLDPESSEVIKQKEKKRIQLSNKSNQLDNQIKNLTEQHLPWALAGKLFDDVKQQINLESQSKKQNAISENAVALAQKIVENFDTPEPITSAPLTASQKEKLHQRVLGLLQENKSADEVVKILNLSDRDTAKVLNKIEEIEQSDVLQLEDLIKEKSELDFEIRSIQASLETSGTTDSEKELFEELQSTIEGSNTQIGRLSVRLSNCNEELVHIENKIKEIELEIGKLYDKHNFSKEKVDFIEECDAIANLMTTYMVKLRKNKVHLLQEKTFEMYKMLSSKSGLIKDLEIDNKTYEITIRDKSGHTMRKSGLSAGEKEVFALSLLWGLAQTSQLNLPIIIDTPLSRLDSIHRDNIVNHYFPNAANQVIILSTDTEVDNNYFKNLEPHLTGAASLEFSQNNELTTVKEGYFWN